MKKIVIVSRGASEIKALLGLIPWLTILMIPDSM